MAGEVPSHDSATVLDGVARVLAVDAATLRDDTPLALLGWDSLARVCLIDIVAAGDGNAVDPTLLDRAMADAVTIGDLVDARQRAATAADGAS